MNRHDRRKAEKLGKQNNNASNGLFGAEENPFQPDALHYLGVIYLQIQDYNTAVDYISQSLLLNPKGRNGLN